MPKSALIDEDATKGAVIHSAVNGINEAQLKGFVTEIEAEQDKIDEIMRKAREACQPMLDEIKRIKKEAAEAQIPKKPLAAKLAQRKDLRRAEGRRETLSEDQRDIFDEISAKLHDLPAFQSLSD